MLHDKPWLTLVTICQAGKPPKSEGAVKKEIERLRAEAEVADGGHIKGEITVDPTLHVPEEALKPSGLEKE